MKMGGNSIFFKKRQLYIFSDIGTIFIDTPYAFLNPIENYFVEIIKYSYGRRTAKCRFIFPSSSHHYE